MREHGEIEELLALEAIGGLEPADGERLAELRAEHGPDCAECAALEAEFRDTAAGLGAALAPARLSDDLEERTVAAALAEPRSEPTPRRGRSMAWLAVAAAIVLLAVGAIGGYLAAPRSSVAAFIQQPGVTLVPFEQSTGAAGTMTLAIGPDGTDAYVIGTGLPTPPDGQVYELWTIAGDTPDVARLRRARATGTSPRSAGRVLDGRRRGRDRRERGVSLGADHRPGAGRHALS